MTMFTTSIPVWLNVTCGNGHHEAHQLGPQTQLTDDLEASDFECGECGTHEIAKINIDGSSNADMKTLEEVRI